MRSSHTLDGLSVTFDDDRAVASAGLLMVATLLGRLGLEGAADAAVSRGFRPGRKLVCLVLSLLAGGDCIDDVDALRVGATQRVLGVRAVAASTVGTWLRSLTFGHVRQLDRVAEQMLTRAWAAGAGPRSRLLRIDIDSTIVEVHGKAKQGAAYGYTRQLGLHPLLATRADTGEVVHIRTRKGSANTARGATRFVREVTGRVRRAGATGRLLLRADSGFWSNDIMAICDANGAWYSISVRMQTPIVSAIAAIDESAWIDLPDYIGARAQVAQTTYHGRRLIVRRTLNQGTQPTLIEDWRHHAFLTNRPGSVIELDRDHRAHALVELSIRDLKHGAGMIHMPSGHFQANAAWAVACTLAHNALRWSQLIGDPGTPVVTAKTLRRRLLHVPGRLVTSGRRRTLRLPTGWPWAHLLHRILDRLRALPQPM